jgi:hypothetical protein
VTPPITFGHVAGVERRVPRVDTLGREGEEDLLADRQPAGLEHRLDQLVGRAGVRGGLEDDERARLQVLGDPLGRRHDERHVRVFRLAQRRRHADADGVQVPDHGEVGGGRQAPGLEQIGHLGRRHVRDVRPPGLQRGDFPGVEVDAGHAKPRAPEFHHQRQPDVSQADHPHPRLAGLDTIQ